MKILFITAFTPSEIGAAVKNTKIMLERLSENHQVDLVYCRYEHDTKYLKPNDNVKIQKVWINSKVFKIFNFILCFWWYPQFTVRFNWWYMHKLKKLIDKEVYDFIIFDHSQMFLYAKFINTQTRKIFISHDVIAQRAERAYNRFAYKWCLYSEKYLLKNPNSRIFTFCQKDCDIIKELYGYDSYISSPFLENNVINVIPNNIQDDYVMFGMWGRPDNIEGALWFFEKVGPILHKKIHIKIIGKGFPKSKLEELKESNNIDYLGFVDNPYPIIANSKAVLAPIFTGAGLKFKVAESLACGTPVIGTDVALEGLPNECSFGMFLANNEIDFASKIENISLPLQERVELKKIFLNCFDKGRVPDYIDSINRCGKFNS